MDEFIIEGKNICKSYNDLQILKHIDIQIKKKEIVSITGASGAGKTTLLQILGTLDNMSDPSGSLTINGISTKDLSQKDLANFRNKQIGFVFQFHNLLPEFTALENICIPAYIAGKNKKTAEHDATELLNLLGLDNRAHHKPNKLSGGEQQRVAIARALINRPAVVFADEPSGNLDSGSAKMLHELFFKLRDTLHQTFVIVTHNKLLSDNSNRALVIKDGCFIN